MAKKQRTGGGTPATTALAAAGVSFTVHEYDHDPRSESYGEEAATLLGIAPERVFKTLLADVDGTLTVAVVPVSGQLDLKALARATGGRKAAMADPKAAERKTELRQSIVEAVKLLANAGKGARTRRRSKSR